MKRKLVALQLLSYSCIVTKNTLRLFLTVSWVGLQYVIVVFPDHTHLLFSVSLPRGSVGWSIVVYTGHSHLLFYEGKSSIMLIDLSNVV